MGKHRQAGESQGNTKDPYATVTYLSQRVTKQKLHKKAGETEREPSRAELLAAMQDSSEALEGKIEAVETEVNLLPADLHNVSDKLRIAEDR
ncbi:hypothetical protein NDU88_002013 [Pleurodeles waltl]|uniref:Uncharacterized protein n=1 Tax=Pleurodeles waltl TaxID=8319 RepID=A0AAV7W2U1_PLEWA|nr:hypothetical protein NDU88_002013 [Pleurodeles waltl]